MNKVLLVIGVFFSVNLLANDSTLEVIQKYEKIIDEFSASCAHLDTNKIPETTAEIFCNRNPVNNISVRYCVYQNLLNPANQTSISFNVPDGDTPDGYAASVTISYRCSDIEI